MAFDDFDTDDTDPTVQHRLDDDLFDFPLVDPFGVAERENVTMPAAATKAKKAKSAAPSTVDAEDDDLFGSPLVGGDASLESFEADVDRLSERVADLIEDDDLETYLDEPLLEDDFGVTPEAPVISPAPKQNKHKQPARVAPREPQQALAAETPQAPPIVVAAPASQSGPFRLGRTGMLVAGLVGVFAFALLGVVWSAGRGMQDALASRNENTSDVQLQSRILELEQLMNTQRQELLAALEAKDEELPELPATHVRVEPEWFVERKLIQQAMQEGRFREARKRLFALQAVMDELSADVREELAPTVAFLIPETYRLQAAEAKGGEQ